MSINFDRIADRYDETRGGVEHGRSCAEVIAEHLPTSGRVFELGVGTGLVADAMARDVVGIDISGSMLAKAHQRLGPRVAVADGVAMPFRDGVFDGGYAVWVFHLVADATAVLSEVARVLSRAAPFAIETTEWFLVEDDPIQEILSKLYNHIVPGERRDGEPALTTAANAAGLDVVAVTRRIRTFEQCPAEVITAIEARVGSAFWRVDDATWQSVVVPALDALRALPDQDEKRQRRAEQTTVVLRNAD